MLTPAFLAVAFCPGLPSPDYNIGSTGLDTLVGNFILIEDYEDRESSKTCSMGDGVGLDYLQVYKDGDNLFLSDLESSACQLGVLYARHPMPHDPGNDFYRSWAAFDRIFTTQPSSPELYGDEYDDVRTARQERPMAPEPFSTPYTSHASSSSTEPETVVNSESLDRVWSEVRKTKERAMAASPSKIESLGVRSGSEQTLPAAAHHAAPRPHLKRHKSIVNFKESRDGRMMTATFELPGVPKEDMHVSYQVDRLVITWRTVTVTDRVEGGRYLRDREEKKFSRTIPLPSGTKFEEVQASRDHRRLALTYPNMRAVRAKPRPLDGS
ncbi:hypothetical protein EVG20_g1853 [Dentipellis fragilis]|uniref:SHSP domain-containing protein n=1 Tax=Dentipellis fragilis TaxID=205917 RepID=A0A4Y9ZAG2_9AGAM|nr:hypothetical protein EVG20_g1853 [Dentipellis fragilis]